LAAKKPFDSECLKKVSRSFTCELGLDISLTAAFLKRTWYEAVDPHRCPNKTKNVTFVRIFSIVNFDAL